ncbi:MAG TPA: hypothetical protein PK468_25260, partial [Candidatus Hydrogenedentes bacterium]|nr:hypothetical protein [Candidatus Hydrogenedentota bacterium]
NMLQLVPEGDKLVLVHGGPQWTGTYAVVQGDGRIALAPNATGPANHAEAARVWPFTDEAGKPVMPPPEAVIAEDSPRDWRPTPPPDNLGWVFLLADGSLLSPPESLGPRPDILWVNRKGAGLEVTHSGPLRQGDVYAVVAPDRKITLVSPERRPEYPRAIAAWWPYVDEKGATTMPHPRMYLSPDGDHPLPITIFPDGGCATDFPHLVE